jgi:hypothetical protein
MTYEKKNTPIKFTACKMVEGKRYTLAEVLEIAESIRTEILQYLKDKRRADVELFAIETEYPASVYHIHTYRTEKLIETFTAYTVEEMDKILRDHDGLRLRPLTVAADDDNGINRAKTKNETMFKFVHDLKEENIFTQGKRIKAEEVERITKEIFNGRLNSRKRHRFDVTTEEGIRIECKGMSAKITHK